MQTPLSHLRFLIVDDQALVRTAMRHMLTSLGAKQITDTDNGEEAIELMLKTPFDIVISDIDMESMNGLQLLKCIRLGERGLRRATRFIMLTGMATREAVQACIQLDVHAFLTKPPKKELLSSRLQHALDTNIKLKDPAHYRDIVVPSFDAEEEQETPNEAEPES